MLNWVGSGVRAHSGFTDQERRTFHPFTDGGISMRLMQNEPGRRGSRPSKDRKQPHVVFSGGPGSTPAVWGGVWEWAWKRGK